MQVNYYFFYHLSSVCFFISNFDPSPTAYERNLPLFGKELVFSNTWAEYYLQKNTFTWINASSNQYFRQIFTGHAVGSWQVKRKTKIHWMIIEIQSPKWQLIHIMWDWIIVLKLYRVFCPHCLSLTCGIMQNYYSTNCNTFQIWSWCSRYLSPVGNRYSAVYVASYLGRKSEMKKCRQKDLKMLRALLSICWIIKQLSW